MPLFQYQGVTKKGGRSKGFFDADSLSSVKEKLQREGIFAQWIRLVEDSAAKKSHHKVSRHFIFEFTRDIAQLLGAKLPLYESLLLFKSKQKKESKAYLLTAFLCNKIKNGEQFSLALSHYPEVFDPLYVSMVRSGEASGELCEVFSQLEKLLKQQKDLRSQLQGALAYPAFLASFCLLITAALLFFVIPSMQELFEDRSLHWMTSSVLAISRFANAHVLALCVTLLIGILGGVALFTTRPSRRWVYRLSLQLPFIRSVILYGSLARLSRILAMLLDGGVPLVEALGLSERALNQPFMEQALSQARMQVIQGEVFSQALQGEAISCAFCPLGRFSGRNGIDAKGFLGSFCHLFRFNASKNGSVTVIFAAGVITDLRVDCGYGRSLDPFAPHRCQFFCYVICVLGFMS